MILDAAVSLTSLIVPPFFDFIKKKFLKSGKDGTISTMNTIATTKPDVLSQYVESLSKYIDSEVAYFNRDVAGKISLWVSNLRASIRPIYIVLSLVLMGVEIFAQIKIDPAIRYNMEIAINSWFGNRLTK